MTKDEFDKLPLLLTPAQAREVLGLGGRQLRELRESEELDQVAVKLPGMKHWRYRKQKLAALAKMKFE